MPERPEIEHFGNYPVCGALVDMRDLAQVFAHMHGQVPLDLTGRPDPELQQISAKRSQPWSLLQIVVECDPDHDHRAGSDHHRADQVPIFEHSYNGCPPDNDSLRMR
jgi:hypothetical protein